MLKSLFEFFFFLFQSDWLIFIEHFVELEELLIVVPRSRRIVQREVSVNQIFINGGVVNLIQVLLCQGLFDFQEVLQPGIRQSGFPEQGSVIDLKNHTVMCPVKAEAVIDGRGSLHVLFR